MMLYNYFTGTGTGADIAWMVARAVAKEFNYVGSIANLANNLYTKFRILYNTVGQDNFSWSSLGGIFLDIADLVVTLVPAANVFKVVRVLWSVANPL